MNKPLVSVLMPVYNNDKYLPEAIKSILTQTFSDFEFIIIDDGSTDNTLSIIEKFANKDPRIRFYRNSSNLGLSASLNIGLAYAQAPLIARMDADDYATPDRLSRQYEFMQFHPEISVCGTAIQMYENIKSVVRPPSEHLEIVTFMLFESSLCHPTIIFKKDIIFVKYNGYQASFDGAEDYDLWQRLSEFPEVRFANLSEALLRYRTHPNTNRTSYKKKQQQLSKLIRLRQLRRLGLIPNTYELTCHDALSTPTLMKDRIPDLTDCRHWLDKIESMNNNHKVFSPSHLNYELEKRWLNLCLYAAQESLLIPFKFLKGRKSSKFTSNAFQITRMIWRFFKTSSKIILF